MKKTIYLLRHGEKEKKLFNPGLSIIGKLQAEKTGIFLVNKNIEIIFSSPSLRTKETAFIIKKYIKKPIKIINNLKERIDFDKRYVKDYLEYTKLCEISSLKRDYLLPNKESYIKAGLRFKKVVDLIINSKYKSVLIISHGGVIADYLRNEFGDEYLNSKDYFFSKYKVVRPCSITQILIDDQIKKISLIDFNNIIHLN